MTAPTAISRGMNRLTPEARTQLAATLARQYSDNPATSVRLLAIQHGISYGLAHKLLTEQGVTLRPRGGANRKKKTK